MENNSSSASRMASERVNVVEATEGIKITSPALRNDPRGLTEQLKDMFAEAIATKHNLPLDLVKAQIKEEDGYLTWRYSV